MTFPLEPDNTSNDFIPENWEWPDPDSPEFQYEIKRRYRRIASNINNRQIGVFNTAEYLTGQQWFDPGDSQNSKSPFRKVFPITDASLSFAHNITGVTNYTNISGTGFDTSTGFHYPIPYVDATAIGDQIQVHVTATNIVITKGGAAPPAITSGFIVLEYLKT